jgi:L-cysteine:1D-myo-inositol 2-amino-2-deoxy-alpha-D-glucopyranoside ligase
MRLYDTRTRAVHDVVAGHTVRIYVCGITPYDSTHLGHAFTYASFDALIRYLEHLGHRVLYTRNITDVDDDILRKARELGLDFTELAEREVARFREDLRALGLRDPDAEPLATETVPAIVSAVTGLVRRGAAYALEDGRVYFDVHATGERFGMLSRLGRAQMLAEFAEKGGDPEAPGKKDALDFLLWQPSAEGEPRWPSPFGDGRPGWHIECSVMAMEEMGAVIDIHGGGSDLVFPHHEAEILQSESLTGQAPFSRFWAHAGMVGLDGEKMSKSVGNLVFVADLRERAPAAAIRRMLLAHHYRSTWSFSEDELQAAIDGVAAWARASADDTGGADGTDVEAERRFHERMADDLDTGGALAAIDDAAGGGAGATVSRLATILGLADLASLGAASSRGGARTKV